MRLRALHLALLVPSLALAAPKAGPKKPPKDDKAEKEKAEKEKAEKEKADKEKADKEKADKEKADKEKADKEKEAAAKADEDKAAKADPTDVDALRQEYLQLRDELFKSRARANAVASQLYSTRVQIKLTYTSSRYYNPSKASVRLDGAAVYEDATGAIGGDDGVRFTGFVAPGKHMVTFRVEAAGKDDPTFSSVTETQIVVQAVQGKDLVIAAKAHDSGNIAYEWKKKETGSYGLGIDVAVKTAARADGDAPPSETKKGGKK